jgi:hypothetical protein
MDNWEREFWKMFETVTVDFEQWFQEVSQSVDELLQDIEDELIQGVEQFIEEVFIPFFPDDFPQEDSPSENRNITPLSDEDLINPKLNPTPENQPACIGCNHYHGRFYGRNLLVCAMHPYGWNEEQCPDWEGK